MSTSNLENNNENSTNNVVNGKNKRLIYGVLFGFVLVIFTQKGFILLFTTLFKIAHKNYLLTTRFFIVS